MIERPLLSSRLLWKINLIFAAIVLLSGLVVALFSARHIRRSTLQEVRRNLAVRSALLAELAAPGILAREGGGGGSGNEGINFEQQIRRLGHETATRMTVILADGRVAADSERDPARMDNHADRPEVRAAARRNSGVSIRFSRTLQTRMMYFARALRRDGRIIGYARTALPLTLIDRRIASSRQTILLGIGIVALLILASALLMSRWFIRPLVAMTAMAEGLAAGDFSHRIHLDRRDEIGRLAESFNQVAENSRRRLETIAFDREKLNAILSGMSEGVIAIDHRERIIHLNRAAAELLGIAVTNSDGRPLREIVHQPELRDALAAAEHEAGGIRQQLTLTGPGCERAIELHAAPLRDAKGTGLGYVIVMLDITELRRLETVRRDFVANASHELKTPITAIRALSETLIDNFSVMDNDERRTFLEKIHTQALRLSAIITDLMALSRFECEAGEASRESIELGGLVEEAYCALQSAAEEKGIRMELLRNTEPVEIEGDGEALLQAITNLLDNAVKYTPAGGEVTLQLEVGKEEVIISVRDTGIGIASEDCRRIFERFYRVDKARSRELGGTGLGLAIVRHIAISHRGRIEVSSRPGEGSTFRLQLPR